MATRIRDADLGPFAPDVGRLNRAVAFAALLAGASITFGVLRAAPDLFGSSFTLGWTSLAAIACGVAAAVVAIPGAYRALVRGESGRRLAKVALWIGATAAIATFVYDAVSEGSIRLDRFQDAYLDAEVFRAIWRAMIRGLINTLEVVVLAEGLAIVVGLVFATWQLSQKRWLRFPAVAYVDLVRGLPLLVLGSLVYFGLGFVGLRLSPFTAIVVTLTVNASAYVAEIFRAGILAIPGGQTDAARSLGMPAATTMLFVLIPQAARAVIPPLVSEFIALIKDSAQVFLLVGTTAATADLFTTARTASASTFSPTPYMGAALGYLLVTVPLARFVGLLERRVRARIG